MGGLTANTQKFHDITYNNTQEFHDITICSTIAAEISLSVLVLIYLLLYEILATMILQ